MSLRLCPSAREEPAAPRGGRQPTPASRFWPSATAILLTLVLAACGSDGASDPVAVVQAAYDRLGEGDVDGFLGFFSDQAVLIGSDDRPASREAIRDELALDIERDERFEIRDLAADGDVVRYTLEVYIRETLIVSYNDGLAVVADSQIIFDGTEWTFRSECERDPSQAFCRGR